MVAVYIVYSPNERPCVSPTMSDERVAIARERGWTVIRYEIPGMSPDALMDYAELNVKARRVV